MATHTGINHKINFFKGLACIFVIFIHARFPSVFGEAILAVARAAVPFFFMVSGYFAYKTDTRQELSGIPRKAKHIAFIAFWACVYNFVCMLLVEIISGTDLFEWLRKTFSFYDIFLWAIWNNAIPGAHLWFLFALLYCYGVFYLLLKSNTIKAGYILIPFLLICFWMQSSFHIVTMGLPEQLITILSRNWIFSGLPFFMLGNLLAKKKEKIIHSSKNISWLYLIVFISLLESIIECCVFNNFSEIYLFTPFLATSCFVIAMKKPEVTTFFGRSLEKIGAQFSLVIYVVHWSIFKGINMILHLCKLDDNLFIQWIGPIVVVFASLCTAFFFAKFKRYFSVTVIRLRNRI